MSIAGHSLGAHCAGAAGKRTARGRVQSIVSMDPAGPLFSVGDSANRVHHTDAVHVENIVTDAGNLGFAEPVGHANVSKFIVRFLHQNLIRFSRTFSSIQIGVSINQDVLDPHAVTVA